MTEYMSAPSRSVVTALVMLLAVLLALVDVPPIPLAMAVVHWFAFRVSARLVASGRLRPRDVELAGAQLVGAVGVALLASVPVVLLPESAELEGVALLLAAFIALVGYAVARAGGATRARALVYALTVLVVAVAIAELKNRLAGH